MKAKATCLKRIAFVVCALFLWAFLLFENVFIPVKADEVTAQYTDVLEDLKKDETFNTENFPDKADDYSLSVIQIAESVNKELFVYAYQPSHKTIDLTATEIRMSMPEVGVDSTYKDYKLTLLSENGVFDKYKVEGVTVKTDSVRYYNIIQIARPWDSAIDKKAGNDNTISTVPFEVAQKWTAQTINNVLTYSCMGVETVLITDKVVGYIQYSNGFELLKQSCDSHFVAFTTSRKIEKLIEADVYYVTQSYIRITGVGGGAPELGEKVENYAYLTADQSTSNPADGLWAKKYTWKRIESVQSFMENESEDINFMEGNFETLENQQWILRFVETDVTSIIGIATSVERTQVSEVTILRLKFETDGVVYNLGVVDNKQTSSENPFGKGDTAVDDAWEKFVKDFKAIIKELLSILIMVGLAIVVCAIVVGLCLLAFYCKPLFNLIMKILGWIFLWPYYLIRYIIRKQKNKRK